MTVIIKGDKIDIVVKLTGQSEKSENNRRAKVKRVITLLLSLALVFSVTGCNKSSAETNGNIIEEEVYTAVEVKSVVPNTLYLDNTLSAKVFAEKDVFVTTTFSGKVENVRVKVGDKVNKDDILFTMNKDDINKQIDQAKLGYESAKVSYELTVSQIDQAKKSLERIEELYKQGAASEQQLEQARLAASDTSLEAAKKGVEQAQLAYSQTLDMAKNAVVKAPISGTISTVNVEVGEYATPSQPPISIFDDESISLQFGVPQNIINKITVGSEVNVEIKSAGINTTAKIDSISTSADPMTNLYNVKVFMENDGSIKPGMFAKVTLKTDKRENVLAVDSEAIIEREGKYIVYIADGDKAIEKEVTTGLDTGDYIEILTGLNEGDKVIVKGQSYVSNEGKIKVVKDGAN